MTRRNGMGSHEATISKSVVWLTPPRILAALGSFDLDPCASDPRPWDTAATHIAPPQDGLSADWAGRVWLNPPYGRDIGDWLSKLADHGHGTAIAFARTETAWFVDVVWRRATAVMFLHGRLHFYRPDGTRARGNAGAPSCLIAFGDDDAERLTTSGLDGTVVELHHQCGSDAAL